MFAGILVLTGFALVLDFAVTQAEKRLLVAIARRLPAWVNSDHLTLLGLGAAALWRTRRKRAA